MKLESLLATSTLAGALAPAMAAPGYYEPPRQSLDVPYGQRVIYLQTPREGVLQNFNPRYASVRSVTATPGGNPYDALSPLPYGAPLHEAEALVIVRPQERVPNIAISPWEPITDRTIDELRRNYPWSRRTESSRNDLVAAQNQFLRERGYIASVRGFKNQSPAVRTIAAEEPYRVYGEARPAARRATGTPQLVIAPSSAENREQVVDRRLKRESIIRRSNPE